MLAEAERGLGDLVNHFFGAALLRKEVKDEEDGDGATGGKEILDPEGFMDGSTWSGWEFFRGLAGIFVAYDCRRVDAPPSRLLLR